MSNINKIQVDSTTYDIEDSSARLKINDLDNRNNHACSYVNYGYNTELTGTVSTATLNRCSTTVQINGTIAGSTGGALRFPLSVDTFRCHVNISSMITQCVLQEGHKYRLTMHELSGTATYPEFVTPEFIPQGSSQRTDTDAVSGIDSNGDKYSELTYSSTAYSSGLHVVLWISRSVDNTTAVDNTFSYYTVLVTLSDITESIESQTQELFKYVDTDRTLLVSAQRSIAEDWHFAFIDVADGMGLGSNHIIPGTKTLWNEQGTSDLVQKSILMSDGVHPFKGDGVTAMYAQTIANQLCNVAPTHRSAAGESGSIATCTDDGNGNLVMMPSVWAGRNIIWFGTSIPAGSDQDAGSGSGATYPSLIASHLGATVVNQAKGASCVRINSSTGTYSGMIFNHFCRAFSRTQAECDLIATNWSTMRSKIQNAPETLTESHITTMKNNSFENLLLPYLNGTNSMPDLFVIDHGHNDLRPIGIDGKTDIWIEPSVRNIADGILAEDTYMTADNYANLKTVFNNDLSGISDLNAFAASLNRNCFKGAVNFIITLILRYNPYARIVIVSDYN